jgi:hypothetical protein
MFSPILTGPQQARNEISQVPAVAAQSYASLCKPVHECAYRIYAGIPRKPLWTLAVVLYLTGMRYYSLLSASLVVRQINTESKAKAIRPRELAFGIQWAL